MKTKWGTRTDGHLFDAWAQIQIWRAMHAVFGKDSPRVFRLCAGQSVSTYVTKAHLSIVDDPQWNPEGFELMGYAIAPYAPQGAATRNITEVSQLYPWLDKIETDLKAQKAALEGRSTQLIGYEGGQQIFPDHLHLNNDPQMGPFYTAFWKTVAPYFDGVFNHFVYASDSWGLKRYPGQPAADAAKWQATMAWYKGR